MLVKSLKLRNFQIHEDLVLEFSPSITTIRGATDAGKSAILRALRWICLNDLPGEEFINDKADSVLAVIRIDIGEKKRDLITCKIGRGKGRKGAGNVYTLDDEQLKAFGQGVPDPISRKLNVSEFNFQGQHDPSFWFSSTGGEVSRQLNAVIDLSVIDTALTNVASRVRTASERVSVSKERLAQAKNELNDVEWQALRVDQFKELEDQHEKYLKRCRRFAELKALLDKVSENRASELIDKFEDGIRLFDEAKRLRSSYDKVNRLAGTVEQIEDCRKIAHPPDFKGVESAYDRWAVIIGKYNRLKTLLEQIDVAQNRASVRSDEAKRLEGMFHEKIKGLKCPECGQTIE